MENIDTEKAIIVQEVGTIVGAILGVAPGTTVDTTEEMSAMGVDSLIAMDLISALESKVGCKLEDNVVDEHPTVEQLADYLFRRSRKL
jgi:acyl carrier protein